MPQTGGLGIGIAFGIACRYILRFMRYMNASIDQQVGLTLALAYLSYYTANSPARVSGDRLSCKMTSHKRPDERFGGHIKCAFCIRLRANRTRMLCNFLR